MTTLTSRMAATELPHRAVASRGDRRRPHLPSAQGIVGIWLIAILVGVALVGPIVIDGAGAGSLRDRLQAPILAGGTLDHPLGTDNLGRDMLARIVLAARASLLISVVATLLAGLIGVTLGLVSGFGSTWLDLVITWLMEVQQALPFVVIAIGLVAVRGNSVGNVIAVLTLTGWVSYARVVRLSTAALRHAEFVEAARVSGASTGYLLFRHVLPNVAPAAIVIATQLAGTMLVYEAGLTFLGLGVPAGTQTWGGLMADGRELLLRAWWVSTLPGVALVAAVLGVSLIGDWLNDLLSRDVH